ncbi:MAG: phosphotransferase [Vicinamibacteria bacterium]
MSGRALFRNPTWSGLRPGLPAFEPAPEALSRAIQQVTGLRGQVLRARLGSGAPTCARFEPEKAAPLFLKIVPASRGGSLHETERLARWLADQGLFVNACLPGYPRPFDPTHVVCAYPYREGRRPRAEARDLEALGASLAELHRTLARYPDRARLEEATDARFSQLHRARGELARGRRAGPDPGALLALARDGSSAFQGRSATSTPIHDDLNPGNILFTEDSDRPLFLDFEDALHSVLPPIYDLAVVIERIVLVSEVRDSEASALGSRFLAAYRGGGGCAAAGTDEDLVACIRGRALRALCTLALSEWSEVPVEREEWAKFVFLEELARERRDVLRAIWSSGE